MLKHTKYTNQTKTHKIKHRKNKTFELCYSIFVFFSNFSFLRSVLLFFLFLLSYFRTIKNILYSFTTTFDILLNTSHFFYCPFQHSSNFFYILLISSNIFFNLLQVSPTLQKIPELRRKVP